MTGRDTVASLLSSKGTALLLCSYTYSSFGTHTFCWQTDKNQQTGKNLTKNMHAHKRVFYPFVTASC